MLAALGPSSAAPAECVELTVILSFYVSSLRLTCIVAPVTISSYAMFFHSMKLRSAGCKDRSDGRTRKRKKETMTTESLMAEPRIKAGVLLAAPGRGGDALTEFTAENYSFFSTTDFSTMTTPALVVAVELGASLVQRPREEDVVDQSAQVVVDVHAQGV